MPQVTVVVTENRRYVVIEREMLSAEGHG